MLEALIAILNFSFGILGLVGLQARAISFTNDAQYRGEAVFLASSLLAEMWADDRTVLAGKYATAGQPGYDAFKNRVATIPGADAISGNPTVTVVPGPTATSVDVTITLRWQPPGDVVHNYTTFATIGQNL